MNEPQAKKQRAQKPSAGPSPAFNPIIAERPVRRFEFLHRRPQVQARVALVLVTARGVPYVFTPDQQPTMGELIWKGARALYEVDMGLHQTRIEADLPSTGDAFAFHAVVDVQWRVREPAKIVSDGITDVREVLAPPMLAQLHRVTRRFDIEKVAQAEDAANDRLDDQRLGDRFGLEITAFLRLTMDDPSRTYLGTVRGIDRETEVEKRTQGLRITREEHNKVLLDGRVDSYRAIIAAGDLDQFALQLAQNPDDVASVMNMLKDERDTNRRQTVDFVTRLIESGAIRPVGGRRPGQVRPAVVEGLHASGHRQPPRRATPDRAGT